MMSDLAVVIVNWNVRDLLRACLTALYADLATSGLAGRVWVVDNASQDGSVAMVRETFPQVRLIASPENRGFAGGNNLALRQILADDDPPPYVWLLNPDTEMQPGAVRTLADFMAAHPRAGMAGPRLTFGDGRFQHAAFRFPGLWQILFDLFPLPARLYESRLNGRYPRAWYAGGKPCPIDHPLGAAMWVRRAVLEKVGLLDEGFHMYCEEVDWCMRIRRAGWAIYGVPAAHVVHHAGQSTGQIQEASFVNLWHSRRQLYDKHYGPLKRRLAVWLARAGLRYRRRATRRAANRGELGQKEAATRIRAYQRALAYFETHDVSRAERHS